MNEPSIEMLPVAELSPYGRNSRTHSPEQVQQIMVSIREFGFTNPILVDATGTIVAGHGRFLAAQQMGLASVPCIRLEHLSEAQIRAYVIADNKLAENAGWDKDMLRLEIGELKALDFNLDFLGFEASEIKDMLQYVEETEGLTDPDEVPEPPVTPITKPGDLWALGHHRILCGDSTSADALKLLMGGGASRHGFH